MTPKAHSDRNWEKPLVTSYVISDSNEIIDEHGGNYHETTAFISPESL